VYCPSSPYVHARKSGYIKVVVEEEGEEEEKEDKKEKEKK